MTSVDVYYLPDVEDMDDRLRALLPAHQATIRQACAAAGQPAKNFRNVDYPETEFQMLVARRKDLVARIMKVRAVVRRGPRHADNLPYPGWADAHRI